VRLGLFPGGIDAGDVTQPDTVEYFRFLDRPGRKQFVRALEGPKGDRVSSGTVFYGFLSLLPGFPEDRVKTWDKGAGEVKQDRLNGRRGGKEGGGKRG